MSRRLPPGGKTSLDLLEQEIASGSEHYVELSLAPVNPGWFYLFVLAHPGSPRQRAIKWVLLLYIKHYWCDSLTHLCDIVVLFLTVYYQRKKRGSFTESSALCTFSI